MGIFFPRPFEAYALYRREETTYQKVYYVIYICNDNKKKAEQHNYILSSRWYRRESGVEETQRFDTHPRRERTKTGWHSYIYMYIL